MANTLFSVSIKGVFQHQQRYLLRKNQRHEYELLGGRLEPHDCTFEHRLRIEFLEESQILITDIMPREPWLYICGIDNIIILPYTCKAYKNMLPDNIYDSDGGKLHWFQTDELYSISLPAGYRNSIFNTIPPKTYSPYIGKYPKLIPGYKEKKYRIRINLYNVYHSKIFSDYLNHFCSPRELVKDRLGDFYYPDNIVSCGSSLTDHIVELNYVYIGSQLL